MNKLTGLDSAFLSLETDAAPMHVASVIVLDLDGQTSVAFRERLRKVVKARLPSLDPLRLELVSAPLQLDHARWKEAEHIDLDFHIRSAALPAPGSADELASEVERIVAQPLGRNRPLWEMWVLEGLERDRVALITKFHHAAIDGVAGAGLMAALLDDRPDAPARSPNLELAGKTLASRNKSGRGEGYPGWAARLLNAPFYLAADLARTSWALGRSAATAGAGGRSASLLFSAPSTPVNAPVSGHRRVAFARAPMQELRTTRRLLGVKINDLVLAGCTQALRRHLIDRDALPDGPLVAGVPVATGSKRGRTAGNRVSLMLSELPVHIEDPLARLRAISRSTAVGKQVHEKMGSGLLERWAERVPPALLSPAVDLYSHMGLARRHDPPFSAIVSNVAGPPEALYCAGLRVNACYPLGPVFDGTALNMTVMSYGGSLHFGAIGCAEAIPQPDELAREFRSALDELTKIGRRRMGESSVRRVSEEQVA